MKKEDINRVFEQNPDLSKLGTKTQYYKYLQTIFPESKVKDIVYHRSSEKIDVFDKTKTKEINGNRFYFSPFNTGRYGQHVTRAVLNIKNLAVPYNDEFIKDVNKKHPEYTKGKSKYFYLPAQIYVHARKYGYDGVFSFEGTNDDEYIVYEPEQIHILGSKKDLKGFQKFVNSHDKKSLEKRVISGIFGIVALAGIYFGIFGMTGAIIGLTNISSSFLGVLLFVGGIFGLVLSRE